MVNVQFKDYTPPPPPDDTIVANIGVFFDGTLNNKSNSDARKGRVQGKDKEKADKAYNKYGGNSDKNTSYNNDWSNIARLWENYGTTAIYVEGIGTQDFKEDDIDGYAFGAEETGIKNKVKIGCEKIATEAKSLMQKSGNKKVTLILDAFGFSRGAAAARHFVYETSRNAKNEKFGVLGEELKKQGIDINSLALSIRFLGLFDTVSSYSEDVWTTSPNFSNDIEELHLDDIAKAKKIVHITAENEHRENFDLTDVKVYNKATRKRVYLGIERCLPGVHSDIGGGYETGIERKDEIINGSESVQKERKKQLVAEGWFKDDELIIHELRRKLSSIRYVKKTYSYIPLQFMAQHGVNNNLSFQSKKLQSKYSITNDALLVRVKDRLKPYVMGNGKPYKFRWYGEISSQYAGSKIPEQRYADYQKELNEQKDLRRLRNEYLHWSADYDWLGMDPRPDGKRVIH